jgi:hypothetical protein
MSLTKSEAMKEIVRCGKDPVYFLSKYAKITEPMRGLIPFDLYPFQAETIKEFQENRFNIILKARQLGLSTSVAGYVCWLILFHRSKNVLVVATKLQSATNLVKKIKQIHKHLPEWLKIADISINNRTSFELSNASQVKASSTSGDAGRSEALSLLVVDEAAHVEGLDELWAGLYPTLSTGGAAITLSTPNGVGNWFHKTYMEAVEEKNDFNYINLPWSIHPDRDMAWFEKETRNMSRREIAQELECSFNASGETVVSGDSLEAIFNNCCDPTHRAGFDRNYWIWEEPQLGEEYLCVGDVARGDGKDYSTVHIIKTSTMEQVAEYQGKLTGDMFAPLITEIAREYNNALLVIENNKDYGVLSRIEDLEYDNLYYSLKTSHEYIDQLTAQVKNGVAGFTMSMKTRPLVVAKLEEFIRNNILTINSVRTASELKTFIWHNGKAQAMRGYNDDLVMALAIGCWVRDVAMTVNKRDIEYSKAMLSGITTAGRTLNTSIPGMREYQQRPKSEQTTKDGIKYDISWIYKG